MNEKTGLAIDPKQFEDIPDYAPSAKDKALVGIVNDAADQLRRYRRPHEKTWYVNHAMVNDRQWETWNDHKGTFENPLRGKGDGIQLTVNMLKPFWKRVVSRLSAHAPAMQMVPATTDEPDVEIARLSQRVIEYENDRVDIEAHVERMVGWMLEAGVWSHVRWDPWAGPLMWDRVPVMTTDLFTGQPVPQIDPQTGEPVTERVPVMDDEGRQLHLGASVLELYSPYEVGEDPRATSAGLGEWIVHDSVQTVEWAQQFKNGKFVKPEKDLYANSIYEKRHRQTVGYQGNLSDEESKPVEASFRCRSYWQRPSAKWPNGRHIVVSAAGVLLHKDDNPYSKQIENGIPWPWEYTCEVHVTGRAMGSTTIESAVGLNKAYNRRRSQEEENTAICGRPKVLIPENSVKQEGAFNSKAGEKIFYRQVGNSNAKPEYMNPPSTAAAVDTAIRHHAADMQEVMSFHESTKGQMPSANAPAAAIEKLQRADESVLGATERHLRRSIVKIDKMLLCNAMQFWTEDRLVRVAGEDHAITAQRIAGAQLEGDSEGNYCDVRMVPQSTMWRDPENQRKMVADLITLKTLDPLQHRREILRVLDLASLDGIFKDDHLDEAWAYKENELMSQGQPCEARDWENHQVHLLQLNRFRKTEQFRRLPPEIQELFAMHAMMHEGLMVQAAAKQVAMVNQAAGMGPDGEDPADDQGAGGQPGGPGATSNPGQPGNPAPPDHPAPGSQPPA